ncbi:MAG: hypothetical protein PHG48_07410 [Eubacteriales bacterium]|nr:hypothetical protein [Eubacteriales bacterium]
MQVLEEGIGNLISRVPNIEDIQKENKAYKPIGLVSKIMSSAEAIGRFVSDGDYLVSELTGNVRGPLALIREVVRQKKRNLRVAGNTSTLDIDLLLAAGAVSDMDLCYVGYELLGISYTMRKAIEQKEIRVTEWSNATMAWRLKAGAMGIPFIPCRSMYSGTDTFKYSAAKIIECPFTKVKLCAVPALRPDVALIHVHRCDEYGNARIDGITGSSYDVAAASKKVIISTEKIISNREIRNNPERTVIPHFLVSAVVEEPFGAHPGNMPYLYDMDVENYREYTAAAKTKEGVTEYFNKYIFSVGDNREYLEIMGREHLNCLEEKERARFSYRNGEKGDENDGK